MQGKIDYAFEISIMLLGFWYSNSWWSFWDRISPGIFDENSNSQLTPISCETNLIIGSWRGVISTQIGRGGFLPSPPTEIAKLEISPPFSKQKGGVSDHPPKIFFLLFQ